MENKNILYKDIENLRNELYELIADSNMKLGDFKVIQKSHELDACIYAYESQKNNPALIY